MDDMDTGSISASGSENRELSEEDGALSPQMMVRQFLSIFIALFGTKNELNLFFLHFF